MASVGPKIIGIYFGDNDFGNAIMGFLKAIAYEGLDSFDFTKDKFVKLYNKAILGFYIVHQNGLRYQCTDEDLKHTESYLQIKDCQVYFDDEVQDCLNKHSGWCNSEMFILDTSNRFNPPYIYSA